MKIVGLIDVIGLIAIIVAFVLVLFNKKHFYTKTTQFLLFLLLTMTLFFSLSNSLEWLNLSSKLDAVEDYLRALEPMLWWGLLYTILVQIQIDKHIKIENKLSDSNKKLELALVQAKKSKELEIANKKLNKTQLVLEKAYAEVKASHEKLQTLNMELKESNEESMQLNEELSSTNEALFDQKVELQKALDKLKKAQLQIIQSEKMASMGILTAGVAYELNNPLNFIAGGATALEIVLKKQIPSDFEMFESLLNDINEGINRATTIIQSLNHFSRQDEAFNDEINIHTLLDNCLIMLNNQIKHKINVTKNFTPELKSINGNEGKLHQLFLNLLTNSIQAIQDKGKISISTKIIDTKLKISIKDNGKGIAAENLSKIMDPFFTTKDPGKGTGMGLSIVYNILQEHKGDIKISSELDAGTEVLIELPI